MLLGRFFLAAINLGHVTQLNSPPFHEYDCTESGMSWQNFRPFYPYLFFMPKYFTYSFVTPFQPSCLVKDRAGHWSLETIFYKFLTKFFVLIFDSKLQRDILRRFSVTAMEFPKLIQFHFHTQCNSRRLPVSIIRKRFWSSMYTYTHLPMTKQHFHI